MLRVICSEWRFKGKQDYIRGRSKGREGCVLQAGEQGHSWGGVRREEGAAGALVDPGWKCQKKRLEHLTIGGGIQMTLGEDDSCCGL